MSEANRVDTMAVKLAAYAGRAGVDATPLLHAYRSAIAVRLQVLRNVFHRELLHPARTALILLEDANCTKAQLLSAAALTETEYPALRIENPYGLAEHGEAVTRLVNAVPIPAAVGDRLLEELVTAQHDVALIALAERLDHARHLHFRERPVWQPFYRQIAEVYLPFAWRVNHSLAVRLERWAGAFGARLAA